MKLKKKSVVAVLTLSMSMGSVLSMVPVFAETSQQNFSVKQKQLMFQLNMAQCLEKNFN